jgi:hypothetical protein
MWQLRFRMGPAEPRALGTKPLHGTGGLSHGELDAQSLGFDLVIVFGVRNRGGQGLGDGASGLARHELQHSQRLLGVEALDLPHDLAHFLRGHAKPFVNGVDFHGVLQLLRFRLGRVGTVAFEGAGVTEFTQFVSHHVFSHEHGVKDFPVVHVERQSDKVRA